MAVPEVNHGNGCTARQMNLRVIACLRGTSRLLKQKVSQEDLSMPHQRVASCSKVSNGLFLVETVESAVHFFCEAEIRLVPFLCNQSNDYKT